MARRYRKRYYRRSKGRWSANINRIVNQSISAPANSEFFGSILLTQNPAQTETSVSQQYTIKNVEFSFDIGMTSATVSNPYQLESITVYIVYVPQGFTVDSSIINSHPEWIMAYRYLGGPDNDLSSGQNYRNPLRVKSRLARRLQTGDGIYWLVTGVNENNQYTLYLQINGIVRWWTKAN